MHVLKTNVTEVIREQFPDFSGHFALQYAGELLVDLLPVKRDGLGSGAQESVWPFLKSLHFGTSVHVLRRA